MRDLLVTYHDSTDRLKIGFNNYPKEAKTTDVLIQAVLRNLVNQINTNHFDPDLGCTLFTMVGRGYRPDEEEQMSSLLALIVSQVEDKLKEEQAGETQLTPEEQLESLDLATVTYDHSEGHWFLDINVKTKANHVYLINI